MNSTEHPLLFLILAVLLLVFGVKAAYWWANRIPSRPDNVSANAVFLWADYVGLLGPKRGWWITCWEQKGRDRCRLSDIDGSLAYEGDFIPYGDSEAIPNSELKINPTRTRENKISIDHAAVPLVELENGKVLIPAAKYAVGKRILEESRSVQ